jgi:hypothetical protein
MAYSCPLLSSPHLLHVLQPRLHAAAAPVCKIFRPALPHANSCSIVSACSIYSRGVSRGCLFHDGAFWHLLDVRIADSSTPPCVSKQPRCGHRERLLRSPLGCITVNVRHRPPSLVGVACLGVDITPPSCTSLRPASSVQRPVPFCGIVAHSEIWKRF